MNDHSREDTEWPQISFVTHKPFHVDLIEIALEAAGAVAITLTDSKDVPIFEPLPGETPLWADTKVTGLFEQGADWATILPKLHKAVPAALMESAQTKRIPDQDWVRVWMDQFKPMQFGERTWIIPSHLSASDPDAVNILLDPGLAFGTGTHPTTALCLQWIDQHSPLSNLRVLDYGTGSGILAIAAMAHSAANVDAVDIDPQALTATQDNAQKNNTPNIRTFLPDDFHQHDSGNYDLLMANILALPLIELAATLCQLVCSGGRIILSGLTNEQEQVVWEAYQPFCKDLTIDQQDGWSCLSAIRQ